MGEAELRNALAKLEGDLADVVNVKCKNVNEDAWKRVESTLATNDLLFAHLDMLKRDGLRDENVAEFDAFLKKLEEDLLFVREKLNLDA